MSGPADPARAFPGGTGMTLLEVYGWECPDGLRGGSAHVHFASTEGYLVLAGAGRLQTLGGHGYADVPLRPGDCLWFTPGTVHRLINEDGGLRILVVMQNAGLPEAGDAVLTFPPEVLADPDRYAAAAALPSAASEGDLAAAARHRRDLAIEGYLTLREQVLAGGPAALDPFLAAAAQLVQGRAGEWRAQWQAQAASVAELTGKHLADIASGQARHLREGTLLRVPRPDAPPAFGMCGRLTTYPPAAAEALGGLPPQRGGAGGARSV